MIFARVHSASCGYQTCELCFQHYVHFNYSFINAFFRFIERFYRMCFSCCDILSAQYRFSSFSHLALLRKLLARHSKHIFT